MNAFQSHGAVDLSKLSHAELAEFASLLDVQEKAYEENKLQLYKADSGKQLEFHKSQKKIRAMVTGNRGGKTTASVIEAIWLALGIHPFHKVPIPNRGKMYGESYPVIAETIEPKLEEWLPSKYLDTRRPFVRNQMGHLIGVNFRNGSYIKVGSYDQEWSKSEGSNWHWVSFDEPPPRELYIANLRAIVDFGGLMWFSMTPLSEPWIFDDIWMPGLTGAKPFIECFNWSSYDNPHLPKESLDLFSAELTDEERAIRIHGKFTKLKGLVIDTYDSGASLIAPFKIDYQYSVYEGLDPHPRKPNAALWKAIDPDGERFVIKDLWFDGGIPDFAREVAETRREIRAHGATIVRSICDTSMNQDDPMFRINQHKEFCRILEEEQENLFPVMAKKRDFLFPGIDKVKDLYRVVLRPGYQDPIPMQYVFKGCAPRYEWELSHYQWPKNLLDQTKPIDKNNDCIDCDRYIESVAPSYLTPGTTSFIRRNSNAYRRLSAQEKLERRLIERA